MEDVDVLPTDKRKVLPWSHDFGPTCSSCLLLARDNYCFKYEPPKIHRPVNCLGYEGPFTRVILAYLSADTVAGIASRHCPDVDIGTCSISSNK